MTNNIEIPPEVMEAVEAFEANPDSRVQDAPIVTQAEIKVTPTPHCG